MLRIHLVSPLFWFVVKVEDVPMSQVPTNDTPGTKTFVDVHISKPRLKPPDPNAYEVAPILSARPVQEMQ